MRKLSKKQVYPVVKGIPAGFPSPAHDFATEKIDLNDMLIEHKAATYFVEVRGRSMEGAGIFSGDLVIVDRSKDMKKGDIVIAVIDGSFTIKRVGESAEGYVLCAENQDFHPLLLRDGMNVEIWGVVTYVIHKLST
jgi:DNA polymerase V